MKSNEFTYIKEERESYLLTYILIIIMITIVFIILRIIFYFFQEDSSGVLIFDLLKKNRDINFKTNYNLMHNGIIQYYEDNPIIEDKSIYLYFWYFIFYPFYIIPFEISVYFWDLLRFISTIYIAIKIKKLVKSRKDLVYFFLFSGIGYFADMYLNNNNWIIQLLLFESYIQLEKNKKLFSGILFTLATFKIILITIPFVFIVIKKIKGKDLIYYFLPFALICIPYIIFPEYFLSMISNWLHSADTTSGLPLLTFFLIVWRLIQPAHLMFISVIILIILANIKDEKLKNKIASLIYISVFVIWGLIWLIILELALFF